MLTEILFFARSIVTSMENKHTSDAGRAQKLLDVELASVTSKEYNPNFLQLQESKLKQCTILPEVPEAARRKNGEALIVDRMMAGRNQIYCEPFDTFDPNAPLRGKKRFNENFRPIRSKINLQIKDTGMLIRDRNNKVTVP